MTRHLPITGLLLAPILSGCAAIDTYDIGRFFSEDEAYEISSDSGRMDFDGVKLIVRPMNFRHVRSGTILTFPLPPIPFAMADMDIKRADGREESGEAPFFVEVLFLKINNESSFHPLDSFIAQNGKSVSAIGYLGPMDASSPAAIRRPTSALCASGSENSDREAVALNKAQGNCFVLKFPMPPPSLTSGFYTIQLGTLRKEGKEVKIPRIKVMPGRYDDIHN